jgi:hypothetical protein
MHKPGMVITYQTGANTWVTEQARGTSVWSQDANWMPFGTGGEEVDLTEINNSIGVLQKNAFRYLPATTNPDTVLTPGAYYTPRREWPRRST